MHTCIYDCTHAFARTRTHTHAYILTQNIPTCRIDSEVRSKESATQKLQAVLAQQHKTNAKNNALEAHCTSTRQLRQKRLQDDARAETLRLKLKAADRQLQRALRRYGHQGFREWVRAIGCGNQRVRCKVNHCIWANMFYCLIPCIHL